jgi:hypothetical protein
MELTQQCIDEIIFAAREVESGALTVTIQARPEDKKSFALKCEYEKRFIVNRNGRREVSTETEEKQFPPDKIN